MNRILLIFQKELVNALRDRRVIFSVILVPLLVIPLVTIVPLALAGRKEREIRERPSRIALTGLPFPELEQHLQQPGRFIIVPDDSLIRAVRLGRLDAVIEVLSLPAENRSAELKVFFNATRAESRGAADKLRLAVSELAQEFLARQIDTSQINLNPLIVQPTNVASTREMSGYFLGMLIGMMAVIGLISGGMVMAIDATAGEKERKTLEILLAAPVHRYEIVLGKYLATVTSGMASVLLMITGYVLSFLVTFRAAGRAEELGISTGVTISLPALGLLILVLLVAAAFIAAIEMTIAVFARSYREAQNYLTPLTIIAILPVVFMQSLPPNPPDRLFLIPCLNTMLVTRELLMGIINSSHLLNTLVSSLVAAALALRLAFRMFRQESVLLR